MKTVLLNCNIVDCTGAPRLENGAVVVEGNQITAIGPQAQVWPKTTLSDGATLLDMKGTTLLPGLMDMHVHLSLTYPLHITPPGWEDTLPWLIEKTARASLDAGITTLRTCGETGHYDIRLRKAIESGLIPGPRLICSGRGVTPTAGHGSSSSWYIQADGADGFRQKSREQLGAGADCIKLMVTMGIAEPPHLRGVARITVEEARAAAETAHQAGKHCCAHIGGPEGAKVAVKAGVDCLEHCYTLDNEAVQMMGEARTYIDPTLVVTNFPEWQQDQGASPQRMRAMRETGRAHLDWFCRAVQAGARPVAGTDHLPTTKPNVADVPVAAIREVQLMVQAGLSSIQALQAATKNTAELCGIGDRLGTLQVGKLADVIAVVGDPIADIQDLGKVQFVMKDGQVIRHSV